MMKLITDGFTLASILAGLWAAWLWLRSSQIPVPERIPSGQNGHASADPVAEQIGEVFATTQNLSDVAQAARKAALISGRAARWTAVSVGAQAIATILGWIPSR